MWVQSLGQEPSNCKQGGRKWQPTQLFCLKNPMDRRAWWATVHRVAESRTGLSSQEHTTKGEAQQSH